MDVEKLADHNAALITIAICTHNRIDDIDRCLKHLMPQAKQAGFPVILVDSASNEVTAESLRNHADTYGLTLLRLDIAGLSLARNAAIDAASTPWIAFIDDDIVVHEGWAENMANAIKDAPARTALIGGRILPRYPDDAKTDHISAKWLLSLSCVVDRGSGRVIDEYNICGGNVVYNVEALRSVGGFPPKLSRFGSLLLSGDESFVVERVLDEGWSGFYDDRFVVDHHIQPERLTLDWLRKRSFWEGATIVQMQRLLERPMPRHLNPVKLAASYPVLRLWASATKNPDHVMRASKAWGSLWALFNGKSIEATFEGAPE